MVKVKNGNSRLQLPNDASYDTLVPNIQGIEMSEIMNAIYGGTTKAFVKGKRPFSEIILPDKSEYSIGQFLQFKMLEMMYLGALLNVNPFDQPAVEDYKQETRAILAKGGKKR